MRYATIPFVFVLAVLGGPQGFAGDGKSELASARAAAPPAAAETASARRAVALDARLAGDDKRTRLIVDLTRKVEMAAFTLADPYRVVVDLPAIGFDLPTASGRKGRGLVSAYRYGLFAPGKARIVLDAAAPVLIDKAFVLDPIDDQPARLVVDLVRTDRETFIRNAAVRTSTGSIAAPVVRAPDSGRAAARDPRPVVVIDPGHGGVDTGALAPSGEAEKEVALAVALRLREILERGGRYRVVMTRADDTFVPLSERVRVARSNRAELFISIHADSISRNEGDARGATVYTVSNRASDRDAARLADKENKADLIAGIDLSGQTEDVAGILIELTHRETKNFSGLFARTLVSEIKTAARLHKSPLRSAGFTVLRAPDVPSVLLELGFLSNAADVRLLSSDAWRDKVAGAMAEAVQGFFAKRVAGGTVR